MRSSWQVGVVILALVGLSGCVGAQQRGRSSSPMEGVSNDVPGRPGWPAGPFRWRFGSADRPQIETARRTGPETDIWPNRNRNVMTRLLSTFRPSRRAGNEGATVASRREASPTPTPTMTPTMTMTAAEANEAIARATRPRTLDASVLATRGDDEPAKNRPAPAEDRDAPPLLASPIPLPDMGPATAIAPEPDAILAQAPPPPPLRPSPRPVEPKPEPVQSEPVKPEPKPEPVQSEPVKPEPKPEPVKPEPVQSEPVKPEPVQSEPVKPEPVQSEPVKPEPKPEPVQPELVKPEPVQQQPAPSVSVQETQFEPVVAPAPQAYAELPEPAMVAAPLAHNHNHEKAPTRWSFWPWKRWRSGGRRVEASAQLPSAQFPTSYNSIAARPLTPCPDHARVVLPSAQGLSVYPSAQSCAAPVVKPCFVKTIAACLHDKLERLRAWKHEHICRHIQNLKAALRGTRCPHCGGHGQPIAGPLASPQGAPVLATSQFGLY